MYVADADFLQADELRLADHAEGTKIDVDGAESELLSLNPSEKCLELAQMMSAQTINSQTLRDALVVDSGERLMLRTGDTDIVDVRQEGKVPEECSSVWRVAGVLGW